MQIKLAHVLIVAVVIGLVILSAMLFVQNQKTILSFIKSIDKVGLLKNLYQPAALYGESCTVTSECEGGLVCAGTCTYCTGNGDCSAYGSDYYCTNPAESGVCTNVCDTDDTCTINGLTGYWCGIDNACHNTCTDGINSPQCHVSQYCSNNTCNNGDCLSSGDCSGQICRSYYCGNCASTQDCTEDPYYGGGYWCTQGGRCSNTTVCSSDGDCESGFWCGQDFICHNTCGQDSECSSGYVCDSGTCYSGNCTTYSNCSAGQLCTNYNCSGCTQNGDCALTYGEFYICSQGGTCRDNSTTCAGDADCEVGGWCGQDSYCHSSCSINIECQAGSGCVAGTCVSQSCTPGTDGDNYCQAFGASWWCAQSGNCFDGSNSCSGNSDCALGAVCDSMACYTGNCLTNSDCNGYTCNNHACTTGCVGDLECNTGYVCSQAGNCLTPTIWTPANCGSDGDWWNDTNNWVGATSYGGVDANAVVRISTGPACYPQIVSNASALEVVMSGDTTLRVNSGQTLDIGNTLFLANGNPGASVTNDGTINVAYFTLNSGAVLNNSGIITISTNFINNGANITNTGTINCPAGKQWSLNSSNCVSSACSFNADCETNFGVSYFCSQAGVCSNASSCLVDSECAVNSWCSQNNSCQSSCSIDGDCHVGDLCVNGSCHNPSCTPGNSGNTYCSNNFGSGWCGQNSLCHTSCSESSDCPNVNDSCINNSCYTTTCTPGSDGNNYCNSAFGSVETPYWCSQTGSCTQGSCSTSVDCALGQVCDSGVCYSGDCLINDDCSGQICTNHTCQSCSTTSDCVSGYNSGYFCSQAGLCRNLSSCSIDSDCETSSWCGQDTTCHATCVENNDCHTGWDCNNGVCQEVSGATCGNSIVETGETCDDGNVTAGDGCSAICAVETHYVCSGAPSVCYRCGDGVKQGSEACDDGNIDNADGCSSTCQVESNYTCDSANPSVCHIISTGSSSGGFTTGIVVPTPPPTTQQLNTTFTNEQLIDYSVNIINKIKDLLNQDLGINAQHSNIPPANRSKTIQLLQRLLESLKQLLKLISFKGILNFV